MILAPMVIKQKKPTPEREEITIHGAQYVSPSRDGCIDHRIIVWVV